MTSTEAWRVLEQRSPATSQQIEKLGEHLPVSVPEDYKRFLEVTNGAQGNLEGGGYVMLWGTTELESLNNAYAVEEFLPRAFLVGTDGADRGLGVTDDGGKAAYFTVPLVGMSTDEIRVVGHTLQELLAHLLGEQE